MRRPTKFAEGGSADKSKARYDRKVADIESDFAKWKKSGKYGNENVAKAKYEQRMADAKDDLAKWTKSDRTETRAAEKAAESALSESRRTKGLSTRVRDFAATGDEPLKTKVDTSLAGRVQTRASAPKRAAPRPATRASTPRASTPAPQAKKSYTKEAEAAAKGVFSVLGPIKAGFEAKTTPEPTKPMRAGFERGRVARERELARARMTAQSAPKPAKKTETPYERAMWENAQQKGVSKALSYAKGGSIDGAAIRGKTKIKRK